MTQGVLLAFAAGYFALAATTEQEGFALGGCPDGLEQKVAAGIFEQIPPLMTQTGKITPVWVFSSY